MTESVLWRFRWLLETEDQARRLRRSLARLREAARAALGMDYPSLVLPIENGDGLVDAPVSELDRLLREKTVVGEMLADLREARRAVASGRTLAQDTQALVEVLACSDELALEVAQKVRTGRGSGHTCAEVGRALAALRSALGEGTPCGPGGDGQTVEHPRVQAESDPRGATGDRIPPARVYVIQASEARQLRLRIALARVGDCARPARLRRGETILPGYLIMIAPAAERWRRWLAHLGARLVGLLDEASDLNAVPEGSGSPAVEAGA